VFFPVLPEALVLLRQAVKFVRVHNLYFLWVLGLGLAWLIRRRIGLWLQPMRRMMRKMASEDKIAVKVEA